MPVDTKRSSTTTLIEITLEGTLTSGAADDLDQLIHSFLSECGKNITTIQYSVFFRKDGK